MTIEEIKAGDLDPEAFIADQCRSVSARVGDARAVNALDRPWPPASSAK